MPAKVKSKGLKNKKFLWGAPQLKNQAVAVHEDNSELIDFIRSELGNNIDLIEIEDERTFIKNIKNREIQIFVTLEAVGIDYIESAGMQDDFQYSKEPIFKLELCYGGAKKEQPQQVELPVEYDSYLSDPFFDSIKWSYPWHIIVHDDGRIEDTTGEIKDKKDAPRLINTANCVTEHQGEHVIKFSQAKLLDDGTIEIFIHDFTASTNDNLKIRIKNGLFSCQYWTTYVGDRGDEDIIWTTTNQKLILNFNQRFHLTPGNLFPLNLT